MSSVPRLVPGRSESYRDPEEPKRLVTAELQAEPDEGSGWADAELELGGPRIGGSRIGGAGIGGPRIGGPRVGRPTIGRPRIGGPRIGGSGMKTQNSKLKTKNC